MLLAKAKNLPHTPAAGVFGAPEAMVETEIGAVP
jgi:hypothetical protein